MRTFHFINSICDTWSSRRLNVKILIKTNLTMKEILLIIVNILLLKNVISKSIVNGQRDADIDPNLCLNIPDETLLNNPSSCEAFYVCRNGHPEASFCPTELYFDPITSSCNFAEQVDCVQDESVAQDHIECPIVSDTNKIVYIPSSVYCERYYICYRGKETLVHCKPGSHWNPKINKCDAPQNVDCKLNNNENTIPSCPKEGYKFFAHPTVCDWFIYCSDGIQSIQQCQFLHHFDVTEGRCKIRTSAKCILDS